MTEPSAEARLIRTAVDQLRSTPFPGALGPCVKLPGHDGDHSEGDEEWEDRA